MCAGPSAVGGASAVVRGFEVRTVSGEFVGTDMNIATQYERTDRCPECGSKSVVSDEVRGEVVCQECSCVLSHGMIDTGAEWTAFTHEKNQTKSRVGSPMTQMLHDKGLTTEIHWKDTDAQGKPLSAKKREQMERLRTWQKRVRLGQTGEQNLQLALSEINRMSSALGIPEQVSEQASVIYREALDDNLVQGRSIEGVACGCLYISCRKQEIPRSLDEFESIARVGRTEIARTYRCLMAELNFEMEPVDPKQFVLRFCSELDTDSEIQRQALEILEAASREGLHSGKSPTGLAGAAIYIASILCDDRRTQSEIAEVSHVTEATIRKRYQEQLAVVDEIEE